MYIYVMILYLLSTKIHQCKELFQRSVWSTVDFCLFFAILKLSDGWGADNFFAAPAPDFFWLLLRL